ncbi:MAG TPA: hypothetical protein VGZ29_13420, partial [Terriglobia bacterium]|nr:hypothetical protein [Terriglobia bacterium]
RAWDPRARMPAEVILDDMVKAGTLVDISSLEQLRALLEMGLGTRASGAPGGHPPGATPPTRHSERSEESASPAPEVQESGHELAAMAEALWTRLEGFQVLVETLEEMLGRVLEYHGGFVVQPSQAARRPGACTTTPAPAGPPGFDAILKSRTAQVLGCAQKGDFTTEATEAHTDSLRELCGLRGESSSQPGKNDRTEDLQSAKDFQSAARHRAGPSSCGRSAP